MAVAIDHVSPGLLMTYSGVPGQLKYTYDGDPTFSLGSIVNRSTPYPPAS